MRKEESQRQEGEYQTKYVDLLSERIGGRAIECSDDWFAGCENLVKPGRGVFEKGVFVASGQLMDGWESRRSYGRRSRHGNPGQGDWCILRMGVAGIIKQLEIDTHHFCGNAPEKVSVQAANVGCEADANVTWTTILEPSDVMPDNQNFFVCTHPGRCTHLKLIMYPDGGIARFRAFGQVQPNPKHFIDGELVDLASVMQGARGLHASDLFYSSPDNLTFPGRGINMGDGWETKRRRDDQNDWAVIKLGIPGTIRKVIIDTAHFKGNFPDSASLEAINANACGITDTDITDTDINDPQLNWQTVIAQTPLFADKEHLFIDQIEVDAAAEFTHVRLNIFPDGGISRLRVFGFPSWPSQS